MTDKKQLSWSNYVLYAVDDKVIITEELGEFSKTQLFEITIDELKELEKAVHLSNTDKKETLFFGLTKAKDRFLLTLSKWGAYIGQDEDDKALWEDSENTYFMTSVEAFDEVISGNIKTNDGSAYRKTLFAFI